MSCVHQALSLPQSHKNNKRTWLPALAVFTYQQPCPTHFTWFKGSTTFQSCRLLHFTFTTPPPHHVVAGGDLSCRRDDFPEHNTRGFGAYVVHTYGEAEFTGHKESLYIKMFASKRLGKVRHF